MLSEAVLPSAIVHTVLLSRIVLTVLMAIQKGLQNGVLVAKQKIFDHTEQK